MHVNGSHLTTLWYEASTHAVQIIDQTQLPHRFEIISLQSLTEFCTAIRNMQVRGAPLIGATAAFGLAFSLTDNPSADNEQFASEQLLATRPTAVNLRWAIERVRDSLRDIPIEQKASRALQEAECIRRQDMETCSAIGHHGLTLLQSLYEQKQQRKPSDDPLNILTHCNAGWLATIDWGTALAPIYKANQQGIPVHVWVDETRPRNQGASLTAWELRQQGIPHTVIADNTGGHLMQHGEVDVCLVGSDRTTAQGDVCNKVGTYLKALAAQANRVPFYVALPTSTIDWTIRDGIQEIPIEQRGASELTHIRGIDSKGQLQEVQIFEGSQVCNIAFDVTPASLVNGLITEFGIYEAKHDSLAELKTKLSYQ